MPRRASWILPPKALPSTMSCTMGRTMATSINAGERTNLRISRSTMAIIRFISASFSAVPAADPAGVDMRADFLVAQLPSGVVDKNIIECRVMDRERIDLNLMLQGQPNQLGHGFGAVIRKKAVGIAAQGLHAADVGKAVQHLLPALRRIPKLGLYDVRARDGLLKRVGRIQCNQLAVVHHGNAVAYAVGLLHILRGHHDGKTAGPRYVCPPLPHPHARARGE